MPQVCTWEETVGQTAQTGVTVYDTFNGTIGPPATPVGGTGATATITTTATTQVNGGLDYAITGMSSASCQISVRVQEASLGIVGAFSVTAAGGALGGYMSASAPTWNGRNITTTVTVLAAAGTYSAFILFVVADIEVYTRTRREVCTEVPIIPGGGTSLPPVEELGPVGYEVRWHRGHRESDAPYVATGEKALATRAWYGWSGRRVLMIGVDLDVTVTDDPPSVREDRVYTFGRYPGTSDEDTALYFTIGESSIGGLAALGRGSV